MDDHEQGTRAYWRARTLEVVAYLAAGLVIMAPAIAEALAHEPIAGWWARLKACEGCKHRRERMARYIRAIDAAEQETVTEAEQVVRREERRGRR